MTPHATTPQHDAHCQTAYRAAFEFGKAARLSESRSSWRESNVGWFEPKRSKTRLMTMDEIKAQAIRNRIDMLGTDAAAADSLKIARSTVSNWRASGRLNCLILLLALGFQLSAFAQKGALAFMLSSPAPVVTNRQTFLVWDNPPGASNRVEWGRERNAWTNGFATINTNRFPVTNGWHYCVKAIVAGVESVPGLWPSNRVGELWLRGMGTNLVGGTNIVRLLKFTNQPPANMQFWGVANLTTGWE